jgi:hypothetical protein
MIVAGARLHNRFARGYHRDQGIIVIMDTLLTTQALSCKLKLLPDMEQIGAIRSTAVAYHNALNYASVVYRDLRERFALPSLMACNESVQVTTAYKTL